MPMRAPRNRARASSFRPPSLTPSTSTSPLSGRSRPAMIMSNVDLPEPEAPTMPTASPLPIVRSTSRKICTRAAPRPRLRSTPRIATAGNTIVRDLKIKPPSYGHCRLFVQALTFAAVLAMASHAAAARTLSLVALRRQPDRWIRFAAGQGFSRSPRSRASRQRAGMSRSSTPASPATRPLTALPATTGRCRKTPTH